MKLYDFRRFINKYSVTFYLHKKQGRYVGGKWEEDDELVEKMAGAIVPINDRKIYGSGGTYTSQDRDLYLTAPLKSSLSDLKVIYKDNAYTVEEGRNFEDYADVAVYVLRWHSKVVTEHA